MATFATRKATVLDFQTISFPLLNNPLYHLFLSSLVWRGLLPGAGCSSNTEEPCGGGTT